MKKPKADFIKILSSSGVPITEEALTEQLKKKVVEAGSVLSNDSKMSPFWSWVKTAVVTPVIWLIRTLLAGHILPNLFVATAERWALELKAWEYNIEPKSAVKTLGEITLTKASTEAVTVPAGSVIQTLPIDGVVYRLIVRTETVIESGSLTGRVLVEAEEPGSAFNLPAGYFNVLPQEIVGIVDAVNDVDWITRLGADDESDGDLALRIQNAFASAGRWHVDDVYRSVISSVAGISSNNVYFRNTGEITPGTADALIFMDVGPTPSLIIDKINQYIMDDGHHGHGDVITCKAMPESLHVVHVDVVIPSFLMESDRIEILKEVEARIRATFRETAAYPEMTRTQPNHRFSISILETEIHNAMPSVESVTVTVDGVVHGDIVSGLTLPRLKQIDVEVHIDSKLMAPNSRRVMDET